MSLALLCAVLLVVALLARDDVVEAMVRDGDCGPGKIG